MNRATSIFVQLTAVCLSACVSTSASAQQCPGRPTLKIDEHTLDFSEKKPVCVRPNGTFEIRLMPLSNYPLNYADVTVKQKTGLTKIKKQSVDSQGIMTVEVGNFTVGTEPKYKIKVKEVGVLDPRVRIIPSYLSRKPFYPEIEDYLLDEYWISLSGLLEIEQYLQEEHGTSIAEILADIQQLETTE